MHTSGTEESLKEWRETLFKGTQWEWSPHNGVPLPSSTGWGGCNPSHMVFCRYRQLTQMGITIGALYQCSARWSWISPPRRQFQQWRDQSFSFYCFLNVRIMFPPAVEGKSQARTWQLLADKAFVSRWENNGTKDAWQELYSGRFSESKGRRLDMLRQW